MLMHVPGNMDITRETFRKTISSFDDKRVGGDENDSHDELRTTSAMHNSIMEPIEMPAWVGGRAAKTRPHSLSFQESFSESSNASDFWNHRGTHVDPAALKFTGNESEEEEQPTGFRLPIDIFNQPKKEDEDQNDEPPEHHGMVEAAAKMDWDAFIRDATVAPSKTEGQGFFGFVTGRNQAIQKKNNTEEKDQAKGLLGTMLDRASDHALSTNSPSVASGTVDSSEKRFFTTQQDETSVVSDSAPNKNGGGFPWNRKSTQENSQEDTSTQQPASNAKKNSDDCSNGSIGSSASWDPYQDIWDEDMGNTAKRVEAERRVVQKRTGKELWQIVRDNRRVIIGKSLRMQDIIMMAKRPWRKAPVLVSEREMNKEESSEVKEPEDVALDMEDELALVSLAPERMDSHRTKLSNRANHKKKHRSKSRDSGSITTGRSSRRSSRRSKTSGKSKTRRRSTSVPVTGSKTESKSRSSSRRRHTVPGDDKKQSKRDHRSKSSSKHSKREKMDKLDSSHLSVVSGTTTIATTPSMAAAFSPPESILDDKHHRKAQRSDDSKRTVTEYSNSSAEISDKVPQLPSNAETAEAFRAFLNGDKEASSKQTSTKTPASTKVPASVPVSANTHEGSATAESPVKANRASLQAFLTKDKAAVAEETKRKRKKKSKKMPNDHAKDKKDKDTREKSQRRHSTATSSKPHKSKSKGKDEPRGSRRRST